MKTVYFVDILDSQLESCIELPGYGRAYNLRTIFVGADIQALTPVRTAIFVVNNKRELEKSLRKGLTDYRQGFNTISLNPPKHKNLKGIMSVDS